MDLQLKGKRALVTGASKGIGRAIAETLAAEGCSVDIASRGREGLVQAAAEIADAVPGAEIRIHPLDLSRAEDQAALAAACGDADILINNAGAAASGSLDETDDEGWRASWELKVFGYINLSRDFYKAMK
ncbi:MAG: SDR family NAD(P)-dependent oxidoreductase, partial [Alphaproteobacteria bacterium]